MNKRSSARLTLFILIAATGVLVSPRALRAQWEAWAGTWMITFFGACGAAGCTTGQYLCATLDSGSGSSYCYER